MEAGTDLQGALLQDNMQFNRLASRSSRWTCRHGLAPLLRLSALDLGVVQGRFQFRLWRKLRFFQPNAILSQQFAQAAGRIQARRSLKAREVGSGSPI